MPHFQKDFGSSNIYADIAGLNDTDGLLINFVNCFINKYIFNICGSIRFLVPITQNQIFEQRGQLVRQQVVLIRNICIDDLKGCMISI